MRILAIPAHYSYGGRHGGEGGGRGFRRHATELALLGHEVSLLHVHFDSHQGVHIEESADGEVRTIYIHARPLPMPINIPYRVILTAWGFKKASDSSGPDVIHAYSYRAGLYARPISRIFRIPYVISEHAPLRQQKTSLFWSLVARWSFAGAAEVLAVSDGLAESLGQYTRQQVTVIPNMVRSDFLAGPLASGSGPDQSFRFISVGRTDPIKGWDLLIRAFAQLVRRGGNATLKLCGGGKEMAELRQLSSALGVSDRVSFAGPVADGALRAHLEASDCHVLASRTETFGIVSIEALALGKPIIMTPTYAAKGIINQGNGIICASHSEEDLALSMSHMMENRLEYDPESIRADCMRRYSPQAVGPMYVSVYQNAVRGQP